jgi:O-succinylbenzoic acid--CoA ligase
MESTPPFELDRLRRDWITGISGEEFYRKVLRALAATEGLDEPAIIQEEDPVSFAVDFFVAASMRRPLVLANPGWGAKERGEFEALIASDGIAAGSILIPTGGTTGGVKLAIHDWESLSAAACAVQDFLGGGAIHSCCVLPLHHVSGLMQLIRSFVSDGTIRFDESETNGCCLSLVPTQLQRMMQDAESIRKMNRSRVVFVGGAAMPKSVEQKARELKLPVVPVYGMTETAAMIAALPNEDFLASSDAGAVPLGDAKISIDPDGSIRIRGSSLFKGYHSGERIDSREGFRTGDAGWLDERGRLHLQGRMDQLINTGGEKVDPNEVQEALLCLDGVAGARVLGEPDEEWGEIVVAYVRTDQKGVVPSEAEILSILKQHLSSFKVPKRLIFYQGS